MAAGMATAVLLREPAGGLVGLGFVERIGRRLFPHVVDLKRVMVTPDRQCRSLGRLLMAGLHRAARELGGIELLRLDYRSGTAVGAFYARCGYSEVGRHPGVIRVAPGDDRDSVLMMRRLDGGPLTYDHRT